MAALDPHDVSVVIQSGNRVLVSSGTILMNDSDETELVFRYQNDSARIRLRIVGESSELSSSDQDTPSAQMSVVDDGATLLITFSRLPDNGRFFSKTLVSIGKLGDRHMSFAYDVQRIAPKQHGGIVDLTYSFYMSPEPAN